MYRSELATECGHCHTQRPLPWGQWQLANISTAQ